MIKCEKAQTRQLKTALRWKIPAVQRQRIQMVLLRESGMAWPASGSPIGLWVLDALNRYRGKGQQKVTVEHVHVHAGGQAVVGTIQTPGGGG
jgi:hypothetical protein